MASKITQLLILILITSLGTAQTPDVPVNQGEFSFNPENKPCLTPEQRETVLQTVQAGIEDLKHQNRLAFSEERRGNHPLFIWPVQKADGVDFNDVWAISNYVDHNSAFNNNLLDYNCGTATYDTSNYNHQGLDIYTWPFTWKLMDDNAVEIIAAAAGQIVFKSDGEFDRSCSFSTTTPWNAVYVQHSDGSVAIYGHMKNGSTTTKNVGDMVAEGEYLGIVGSSGVSTGPHLHFEVYEGIVNNVLTGLIDPFAGSCNGINTDSWWADQKPYVNPKINAALTHSQIPDVFPPCPTTETPHITDTFETDDDFYFAAYLRDQTVNDNITFEIIRPDNTSLFGTWNATAQTTASSWYYYYGPYTGFFDMEGEWEWRVTFAGETVVHSFNVTASLSVDEEDFNTTTVYPNPFNDIITIASPKKISKVSVVDILGKSIVTVNNPSEGISTLDLSQLSNGLYFIRMESDTNEIKTIKMIKK